MCVCKHDHKTHTHTALPGSHDVYQDIPTRDSAVMKESAAYGSNSLPQLGVNTQDVPGILADDN